MPILGNRTIFAQTITSTLVMAYMYDAANRLTSVNGQAYTWDNNGSVATYTQDLAAPLPVVLQARTGDTTTLYLFDGHNMAGRLTQLQAMQPTTS